MKKSIPPLTGNLDDFSILYLLSFLNECSLTVKLTLKINENYKTVHIKKGKILSIYSNLNSEQLPALLDRMNILKQGDLLDFLRTMESSTVDLLSILRSYKSSGFEIYQKFVNNYFLALILQLFTWKTGKYTIELDPNQNFKKIFRLPDNFNSDLFRFANNALQNSKDKSFYSKKISGLLSNTYIKNGDSKFLKSINDNQMKIVLELFDGRSPLNILMPSIRTIYQVDPELLMFEFIEFGSIIKIEDANKEFFKPELIQIFNVSERIDKMNYFEILDLEPEADFSKIKSKYYQLARKFHPDNYKSDDLLLFKPLVESYFGRITEAYSRVKTREEFEVYKADLAASRDGSAEENFARIMNAENKFNEGVKALGRNEVALAQKHFEAAINLYNEEPEYHLYVTWAKFLLKGAKDPQNIKETTLKLKEFIKKNPKSSKSYLFLGRVFKFSEDYKNALFFFEQALNINSSDKEVNDEIVYIKFKTMAKKSK